MKVDDEVYDELRRKYLERIDQELNNKAVEPINTREYEQFRIENLPKIHSFYEKACKKAGSIIKVSADKKTEARLKESLEICHLDVTPSEVVSLSALVPLLSVTASIILFLLLPTVLSLKTDFFVLITFLIGSMILYFALMKVPEYLANNWRMKASNQVVLATFYLVTFMRHTSNLELAIDFAAEHLDPPISLDMKKIIWDMETGKFPSLRESLDNYLEKWSKISPDFVESVQNIESSLLEADEGRRLNTLEKALTIMLDNTYEGMIHYTHDLKGPITTLHMLGIILPILGLVILPLIVSFMPAVKWYHIGIIYNLILPISVYMMGKKILSHRPNSYGRPDLEKQVKKVVIGGHKVTPFLVSITLFGILTLIAILPLLIHIANPYFDIIYKPGIGLTTVDTRYPDELMGAKFWFLEYRDVTFKDSSGMTISESRGPFGLIATLLSFGLIMAVGLGIGVYYRLKTKPLMKARRESEKIEMEFASALFQLGNRLADGLPLEIAFSKVSSSMSHSKTKEFFDIISINITKLGLSVEEAIFDEKHGAIKRFPSNIIESSMKVLVESAKKGPLVASAAIINVSNYIKQMHRVDERLKDLLADVVSSMKSQISFLTPVIAGIVVAITAMITNILGTLTRQYNQLQSGLGIEAGSVNGVQDLLANMQGGIPTYFFQIVVGLYVVQIVFILSSLVNGIENGIDKLGEHYLMGENLFKSTILYVILAAIMMVLFSMIAGSIVNVNV